MAVRIAWAGWRRPAQVAYGAICVLMVIGGARMRFSVPLWPLVQPDSWGYLWPALSAIEAGQFVHTAGRAFPYPLFLWGLLAGFDDFRAITVAQYVLGLGTALLALAGWHVAARMIDPPGRLWPLHALGGGVILFATLYYLSGIDFERTILTEALFTFAMTLTVTLSLLAVKRCRDRGDIVAVLLLCAALASSLATLSVKPHWLLAVGCTAAILVLAGRAARIGWTRLAIAIVVPVVLFVVGFMVPERRLAETHDRLVSNLFLPQTMFCWHLAAVLPAMRAQAADPGATPEYRALAEDAKRVLKAEVLSSPGWYFALGYDADRCLYGSFGAVVARHFNNDIDRMRDFYWRGFVRGVAAHPGAYAAKVLLEMREAVVFPLPYDDGPSTTALSLESAAAVAGRSPMFDRAMGALARSDEPKRRAMHNLSVRFYRTAVQAMNRIHLPVLALALAAVAVAATPWGRRRLAPMPPGDAGAHWRFAPLLVLAALQLGINLTIAMSHSHAVSRYRMAQYPLTILVFAAALLTIAVLVLAYRDSRARRR